MCHCIAGLYWCEWLWVAKYREHLAHSDSCFCVDLKGIQFCHFGLDKYDASLWIAKTMLLAR